MGGGGGGGGQGQIQLGQIIFEEHMLNVTTEMGKNMNKIYQNERKTGVLQVIPSSTCRHCRDHDNIRRTHGHISACGILPGRIQGHTGKDYILTKKVSSTKQVGAHLQTNRWAAENS